ncbi:hypothetical protein [Geofilum rubicundum]|uniref:Uncharacterized protein n=1 Tax=Geofilum rubicundum JCM 15548 TaxID=1236989 RepID=A0A0E9M1Y1_9BACT|nr:hypothetical protein [Geofilum rubicundum]GAO31514.1 hypothetical protein JCM15548_13881 [Geofilum rubicundum JCM 15548]
MKTNILLKSRQLDVESPTGALSQLRSIKQTGAFLLLLFATLIFALFLSSCDDDENKDDLDLDLMEENTTLNVSGGVDGNFKAIGQLIELYNNETQFYVSSFQFFESEDSEQSRFHITISRYGKAPLELGEHLHSIDNTFLEDEETEGFGAVVLWLDDEDNPTVYSEVENSSIKIEKVTNSQVTGEFTLNVKAVGYDETPPSIRINGSFKIPRITF